MINSCPFCGSKFSGLINFAMSSKVLGMEKKEGLYFKDNKLANGSYLSSNKDVIYHYTNGVLDLETHKDTEGNIKLTKKKFFDGKEVHTYFYPKSSETKKIINYDKDGDKSSFTTYSKDGKLTSKGTYPKEYLV